MTNRVRLELHQVSGVIFKGPVWLDSLSIAADGAVGSCTLYEGANATGEEKAHLDVLSGTSFQLDMKPPVLLERGMYLTVAETSSHVMIAYHPADKHDALEVGPDVP